MNIPASLKYTKEHEWIKLLDGGEALVGITDFAQNSLGDITFVDAPRAGSTFGAGDSFGVVESVKAASDLYMPLDAEILESNGDLDSAPEKVNSDPYESGWIVRIKILDESQVSALMDAAGYAKVARD